jgi:DNA-directed RNA polymerase specialized sigma24 family protein
MIDLARGRRVRTFVPLDEERERGADEVGEEDCRPESENGKGFDLAVGEQSENSFEAEMNHERRRKAVRYALDRVSPMHKILLIEHYFNGKSYDELAKISGHARGAMGTTLLRARRSVLKLAHEYLERGEQFEPIRLLDS